MGNWLSAEERERFPLTIRKTKKYGWRPDLPDQRDIMASFPPHIESKPSVDLRMSGFMPIVYNQENLGSCTANALVAAFEFDQRKQSFEDFLPSRQFVYYNERAIEGTVDHDSGASIRDGIKTLNRIGVCPEEDCPYDVTYFTERPSDKAYEDAAKHKTVNYRRVRIDINDVMKSLSHGFPVVFGFTVYESFESENVAKTGIMPIPKKGEKILGGHAVLAVGYNAERKFILVRNSWGTNWGQKGYFWMSYDFFTPKNCADAWIIQRVKDNNRPMINVPKMVENKASGATEVKQVKQVKQAEQAEQETEVQFKELSDNEDNEDDDIDENEID